MILVNNLAKVTRNRQVTIPATVREKLGIKEGDFVRIIYDESEGIAKIVPVRKKRITVRLSRKISVKEIERLIEKTLDETTSLHKRSHLRDCRRLPTPPRSMQVNRPRQKGSSYSQ